MSLTPDLVEWLLADRKVCEKWRSLALRLKLRHHIDGIEKMRGDETAQLRRVIKLWQMTSPESFTIIKCKQMLTSEGLYSMVQWLDLMVQAQPHGIGSTITSDYYSLPSTPDSSRPPSRGSYYDVSNDFN